MKYKYEAILKDGIIVVGYYEGDSMCQKIEVPHSSSENPVVQIKITKGKTMSEDLQKEKELRLLQGHLNKLLSDETYTKIDLGYVQPSKIKELLEELPEEICELHAWDDFETNGWDVDFWFYFKYNGVNLMFTGSWYYGNYSIIKR